MKNDNWEIYSYVGATVSSILIILCAWQGTPFAGHTSIFLLFVLIVLINSWAGGIKTGLITTGVATLSSIFFFILPAEVDTFRMILDTSLFTLFGIAISFILEKYKSTDIVSEYRKKNNAYQKQIMELTVEGTKMHEEIRMRDEFLSIASHELKTPLTSMLLKIQMILHNIKNVSLANFSVDNLLTQLETAEEQTKRLSRMITDLLNVSLITTGKLNLEMHKEDLTEIVKEVAQEFFEKLEKGGYELTLKADEKIEMQLDKVRIAQVITNLISNAIKYGDGKPLSILVAHKNGIAKIVVKDQGLGIPQEEQAKVFQLFERGVAKNGGIKGLGVGLYISNQIVKAHAGVIKVESEVGRGSIFTVELPIKK